MSSHQNTALSAFLPRYLLQTEASFQHYSNCSKTNGLQMQDTFSATSKRDVAKTCGPKDISSHLEIIYFPTPTAARNKMEHVWSKYFSQDWETIFVIEEST
jgi:hypothetical protein